MKNEGGVVMDPKQWPQEPVRRRIFEVVLNKDRAGDDFNPDLSDDGFVFRSADDVAGFVLSLLKSEQQLDGVYISRSYEYIDQE